MSTNNPALSPCPFCGSEKVTIRGITDGNKVYCLACGAGGPPAFHGPDGWPGTRARAANDWNKRAEGYRSVPEATGDARPADCRFRLRDEGKPYPRSSCASCGRTITSGLGRYCHRSEATPPASPAATLEPGQRAFNAMRRAAGSAFPYCWDDLDNSTQESWAGVERDLTAALEDYVNMLHRCEGWLGTHPEGRAMQLALREALARHGDAR